VRGKYSLVNAEFILGKISIACYFTVFENKKMGLLYSDIVFLPNELCRYFLPAVSTVWVSVILQLDRVARFEGLNLLVSFRMKFTSVHKRFQCGLVAFYI